MKHRRVSRLRATRQLACDHNTLLLSTLERPSARHALGIGTYVPDAL